MKIISKISIHPLTYIVALICILIGHLKDFEYLTIIILVHELGHVITALLLKWDIDKIIILPIGGMTKFKNSLNKPLIEEFLIAIFGIVFQTIFYIVFSSIQDLSYFYYLILIINIIPVYPLDGSKLLNILFNKITSFKTSYLLTIKISYVLIVSIIILSLIYKKVLVLIIFLILLIQLYKEYKNVNYTFNKFCLERYLNKIKFKKINVIIGNDINKIKRDYYNMFYINSICYKESDILKMMFDNN